MRTSHATTVWENNQLHFKAFGGPTVVKRYIEDGVYKWEYPNKGTIEMKRICKVPEHARSFDRSHTI
jgi:hypothetical protein